MKKIVLLFCCLLALTAQAQTVTKTTHKKAVKTDAVTTGTVTIRKPDYICISVDNNKDQLIMDGTQFTMTMGKRKHVTDSKKNAQFVTFQQVLTAVINNQPIPASEELTILTKGGLKVITITPVSKKRQLFSSFVLTIDAKTSAFRTLRMNGRGEDYTEYTFQGK
jgi:hypothetical protein